METIVTAKTHNCSTFQFRNQNQHFTFTICFVLYSVGSALRTLTARATGATTTKIRVLRNIIITNTGLLSTCNRLYVFCFVPQNFKFWIYFLIFSYCWFYDLAELYTWNFLNWTKKVYFLRSIWTQNNFGIKPYWKCCYLFSNFLTCICLCNWPSNSLLYCLLVDIVHEIKVLIWNVIRFHAFRFR